MRGKLAAAQAGNVSIPSTGARLLNGLSPLCRETRTQQERILNGKREQPCTGSKDVLVGTPTQQNGVVAWRQKDVPERD